MPIRLLLSGFKPNSDRSFGLLAESREVLKPQQMPVLILSLPR